jgi:sensor histidine kinase YesM
MANSNETYSKGIGLVNVKKRLDMIYPKNYILTIDGKNEQFSVNLSLQLNE